MPIVQVGRGMLFVLQLGYQSRWHVRKNLIPLPQLERMSIDVHS